LLVAKAFGGAGALGTIRSASKSARLNCGELFSMGIGRWCDGFFIERQDPPVQFLDAQVKRIPRMNLVNFGPSD